MTTQPNSEQLIIPLGNGQALIRGATLVDCYRALAWRTRKAREAGEPIPARLLYLERILQAEAAAVLPPPRQCPHGDSGMRQLRLLCRLFLKR